MTLLNPLDLQVQAFLDDEWVDLVNTTFDAPLSATNRLIGNVQVTQGRADEDTTFPPASCSVTLWNDDGYLTPDNPGSPYWDVWKQGCPLRVTVRDKVVFWGEIAELDVEWPEGDISEGGVPILDESGDEILDETGAEILDQPVDVGVSRVNVTAAGILRRLGQGKKPLRSPIHRLATNPTNLPDVTDYFPMEDGGQSAFSLSGLPNSTKRMELVNLRFAADDTLGGSEALPSVSSGQDAYWMAPVRGPSGEWHIDQYFRIPSNPTDSSQRVAIFDVKTTGTIARYTVDLIWNDVDSEPQVWWRLYNSSGQQVSEIQLTSETTIVGDEWRCLRLSAVQDGGNVIHSVTTTVVVDGFRPNTSTSTVLAGTAGRPRLVRGAVSNCPSGGVSTGHLIVHGDRVEQWLNPADIGWVGEKAMWRYIRLSGEQGMVPAITGDPDDTVEMGRQRALPLLDLLNQCADADDGTLCEVRHLMVLVMRTRHARYNLTPVMTLDARQNHIANPFRPVADDQNHRNDVTARQIDGATARQFDEWAIEQDNGPYDVQYDLSVYDEDTLPDHASWRLHTGVTRATRYPQLSIDFGVAPTAILDAWLNRLVGHRIAVINLPPQHPLFGVHLTIEGWTESWAPFEASVTINCSPGRPWNVAVWERTRYTAKGAKFTEGAGPIETEITVTSDDDPWDPDAVPFDIIAGPERMTVTDIVGTGANQTFTVVREVNGYRRFHPDNTTFYAVNEAVNIPQPVGPVMAL